MKRSEIIAERLYQGWDLPAPIEIDPLDFLAWAAALHFEECFPRRSVSGGPLAAYLRSLGAPSPKILARRRIDDDRLAGSWKIHRPEGFEYIFILRIDLRFGYITKTEVLKHGAAAYRLSLEAHDEEA